MAYYNRFRGTFDHEMNSLHDQRQSVIDAARNLQPANIDELLAANADGELDHELEWVNVPNPWKPAEEDLITVRPILSLTTGYEDAEREKDRSDKGVWRLGLETRLPSGDSWYLGNISFFYADGKQKLEPMISINTSPTPNTICATTDIRWESADAQLLLTLAEGALQQQPNQ